ncbi:MAG: flagellar motor switch protein FliN [Pirellulaceae bacterium]|nr:flagellar motor switch protein FliN [Pirellulaceae bacterium]
MCPEDKQCPDGKHLNRVPPSASVSVDESPLPPGFERFELMKFAGTAAPIETPTLEVLDDLELDVRIDLGQAYMRLDDVLRLEPGAVVPLDKAAEEPVDVIVGGQVIARGEVLVLDGRYGIRVTSVAGR